MDEGRRVRDALPIGAVVGPAVLLVLGMVTAAGLWRSLMREQDPTPHLGRDADRLVAAGRQ